MLSKASGKAQGLVGGGRKNEFDLVKTYREEKAERDKAARDGLDRIIANATPPERCGPEIIAQPARGPMVVVSPMGLIPDGKEGWKRAHVGYRGRDHVRAADAFDRMEAKARGKGGEAAQLFTEAQKGAGRRYAMLAERHAAAGMRCSSVEAQRGGGSGGGSFIDSVVHEGDLIRAMRAAVGGGSSLVVRRIRRSKRGSRVGIADLALVDAVCLSGQTVSEVLRAHGWAIKGETVKACCAALCAALDRMALARVAPRV